MKESLQRIWLGLMAIVLGTLTCYPAGATASHIPINPAPNIPVSDDQPDWFKTAIYDAMLLLHDSPYDTNTYGADYFYQYILNEGVQIQWEDGQVPLQLRVFEEDKIIRLGYALAEEPEVNATLLMFGVMFIRDYHTMGPCLEPWTFWRALSTARALSLSLWDFESQWFVTWMNNTYQEVLPAVVQLAELKEQGRLEIQGGDLCQQW